METVPVADPLSVNGFSRAVPLTIWGSLMILWESTANSPTEKVRVSRLLNDSLEPVWASTKVDTQVTARVKDQPTSIQRICDKRCN